MASQSNCPPADMLAIVGNCWKCHSCHFQLPSNLDRETAGRFHSDISRDCASLVTAASGTSCLEPDDAVAASQPSFKENSRQLIELLEPRDFTKELGILKEWICPICMESWRNVATKTCRHLPCCASCLEKYRAASTGEFACMLCRGVVVGKFPVKFHSANRLSGITIPCAFPPNSSNYIQELVKSFCEMGFDEVRVKRAIRQGQELANETIPSHESVLDMLVNYPLTPNAEDLESCLNDPNGNPTVKQSISEYLRAISKCLICKQNSPDMCFFPCCHLAICESCWRDAKTKPDNCPDCGNPIRNNVKLHV